MIELKTYEKMRFFFVRNGKISRPALVHSRSAGLLGVEVVLSWLSRQNLAVFRHFEALCV